MLPLFVRLFGPPRLFLFDDGSHTAFTRRGLVNDATQDSLIKDSVKKVRDALAQVPEGKTGALVISTEWKWGFAPVVRAGLAHRMVNGWEIAGDAFISKADKGVSVRAVRTW